MGVCFLRCMDSQERWKYLTSLVREYASEVTQGYGAGASLQERIQTRSERQQAIANEVVGGVQNYLHGLGRSLLNGSVSISIQGSKRYLSLKGLDLSVDDLVQEASAGLIEQFHTYDPSQPIEKWLRLYGTIIMHRAGLLSRGIVRLPKNLMSECRKKYADSSSDAELFRKLAPDKSRNPSIAYFRAMYMRLAVTNDWRDIFGPASTSDEERKGTFEETYIPDEDAEESILSHTERAIMRKNLQWMLEVLTPREKNIIFARYGFNGEVCSLHQIVDTQEKKISRESIRQIEATALRKLRLSIRPLKSL